MQIILAPHRKNDLQVAFNRNKKQISLWGKACAPNKILTHNQHTEPISTQTSEIDIAKLNYVSYYQTQTTKKIGKILIENQYMFLVLFWCHQSIEDKCVGCCSCNSDDHNSALEIKSDTIWWRRRRNISLCSVSDVTDRLRCHGNRQVPVVSFISHLALCYRLSVKTVGKIRDIKRIFKCSKISSCIFMFTYMQSGAISCTV